MDKIRNFMRGFTILEPGIRNLCSGFLIPSAGFPFPSARNGKHEQKFVIFAHNLQFYCIELQFFV